MIITGKWADTDTSTITINAPGAGRYNILKSINVIGDSACNILVQSPSGTTVWQTELQGGGGGFDTRWADDDGIYGAENQAMLVSVSAGTYKISVTGVIVG